MYELCISLEHEQRLFQTCLTDGVAQQMKHRDIDIV